MSRTSLTLAAALAVSLAACNPAPEPELQYGTNVDLPEPKRGLMPQMVIADPSPWGDQLPAVPAGYAAEFSPLTRGAERPSAAEIEANPRAASARLRAITRNQEVDR